MKNQRLLFSNKDVFKVWFIADLLIGLIALVWCLIEKDNPKYIVHISFKVCVVGLIFSIPSLFVLLIVNYFLGIHFYKLNQYYLFVFLVLTINQTYFIVLYILDFFANAKEEGLGFIITSIAGLISLSFVYLKKLKLNSNFLFLLS